MKCQMCQPDYTSPLEIRKMCQQHAIEAVGALITCAKRFGPKLPKRGYFKELRNAAATLIKQRRDMGAYSRKMGEAFSAQLDKLALDAINRRAG